MNVVRPRGVVTQPFGRNFNDAYKKANLKGHTGIDVVYGFGKPHWCLLDGEVYKTLNRGNPDPSAFRGIYTICETDGLVMEILYGHCDEMWVEEGNKVKALQPIMTEGNTGLVFVRGRKVTKQERLEGSKKGAHLHLQGRPVVREKTLKSGEHYLNRANGQRFKDKNGYYYRILLKDNGYRGCMDLRPFFYTPQGKQFLYLWAIAFGNLSAQKQVGR